MVAIKTLDGKRSPNSSKPSGRTGPRGGTGKSNSPSNILLKLMEKHPRILKLISSIKKKKPKTMKAAKGGMTKKQFDSMSTAQMDKLSNDELMNLLIKFYPSIGKGETDQETFKISEGGYRKKGGVIQPRKAAGGGMMDMRKTGMFYGGGMTKKKTY